ncbi:hypothetical protein EIP86_001878 [Pleurotus ostreatoroseus]|nr:hypothetical protein EIP86_001878 [Pleurotus ostreatoroseus]
MSIWIQPGVKMGPIILLVFFAWWGFNTLSYFVALFFQEVQMLNPLQTAIRLIPMGISGIMSNIVTGYLVAVIPGQVLVVLGLLFALAACLIFSLIKVTITYWAMGFIIVVTLPVLDIAYTVANMQVCSGLPPDSQALAGSIFSVATRLGTSFGLAVTSAVANSVSVRYNKGSPQYGANDPAVLMVGFRAAGWTCCGTIVFALIIAIVGMRGVGLVGQEQGAGLHTKQDVNDVEAIAGFGESTTGSSSNNGSITTLTNHVEDGNGKDAKSV